MIVPTLAHPLTATEGCGDSQEDPADKPLGTIPTGARKQLENNRQNIWSCRGKFVNLQRN